MLTTYDFLEHLHRRPAGDASIVVVFMASFRPIGESVGIPGVAAAARHLTMFLEQSIPEGAEFADLTDWTYALFLPGASPGEAGEFAEGLVRVAAARTFDMGFGEQEPLYLTVGVAALPGGLEAPSVILAAARLAEADQGRYPDEWRYPVVLPDQIEMADRLN
jgi:hypothetical protein